MREYFDKHVKTNNPYNKGIYYAFITWDGYDFENNAHSPKEAKERLWAYLTK